MKKQSISDCYKVRAIEVSLIVLIGLVIITPFCGLLFRCGCDWPWLTFYFECNYFQSGVSNKCPWCHSGLAGFGSIGAAFICATAIPLFFTPKIQLGTVTAMTVKVAVGLSVFILAAAIFGALAAYSQHYPFGIGSLLVKPHL